jgi:hypothetical protein
MNSTARSGTKRLGPGYFSRIFSQLPIEFPCSIFPSPLRFAYFARRRFKAARQS